VGVCVAFVTTTEVDWAAVVGATTARPDSNTSAVRAAATALELVLGDIRGRLEHSRDRLICYLPNEADSTWR
jgi:hypothetical protein